MIRYCLWEEPWIPVLWPSGEPGRLSLRDVLLEAHRVREVVDASPLVTVAVHRLLIALVYRVYRIETVEDWVALWKAERLDPAPLDRYRERWHDRFHLFHPDYPFYQVPYIPDEKVHPISALVMEAASGNNPTLFDHGRVEGRDALPPHRATCHLLAHQLFALGGGVSKPFNRMDGPLAKGLVVEAVGRSLFETLLLNAMPLEKWERFTPASGGDAPFWEIDDPPEPVREGTLVRGPLHYLTWQSRQIHLCVDESSGEVTGCQIRQRYALPKDGLRVDPAKPYQTSEETGYAPFRLSKERAAWQYTHVLLQSAQTDVAVPFLIEWLEEVQADRFRSRYQLALPPFIDLHVTGLSTDPQKAAKVELWRRERLPLPLALLERPDLLAEIDEMLGEARRVEGLLVRTARALIWATAERTAVGDAVSLIWTGRLSRDKDADLRKKLDMYKGFAQSLGMVAYYWPALEGAFKRAVEDLLHAPPEAVRQAWRKEIQDRARGAFRAARDSLLHTEASYEVLTRIGTAFHGKLARLDADRKGSEQP